MPFEDYGFVEKELLRPAPENETIDEEKSDDQRFGENKLYQTRNGGVLPTFPVPSGNFAATVKFPTLISPIFNLKPRKCKTK